MKKTKASHTFVKHFSAGFQTIDIMINQWLEDHPDVIVLGVKFSSSATEGNFGTDALIIFTV